VRQRAGPRRVPARRRYGTGNAGSRAPGASGQRLRRQNDHQLSLGEGGRHHLAPSAIPEIVVTSAETIGTQGLGRTLSATRYAYGGAELLFDSALDAFTLPAYGRSVELRLISVRGARRDGLATITDTYRLVPFALASNSERFGRYLRAGRVGHPTL
jgi:hypothetical protein